MRFFSSLALIRQVIRLALAWGLVWATIGTSDTSMTILHVGLSFAVMTLVSLEHDSLAERGL